jgi:RNA polymerase sigma-54 factor
MHASFSGHLQQKSYAARIQQSQLLQMDLTGLHEAVQGWLAQNVMLDAEQTFELDADDGDDTLDMAAVTSAPEGVAELPWDATLARLSRGDDFADESAEARLAAPESDDPQVQVLEALAIESMSAPCRAAAEIVLAAMDESGFLATPLSRLATQCGFDVVLLEQALGMIQTLGPAGYGARSLDEALELQLSRLPRDDAQMLALRIVQHGVTRLSRRDLDSLRRALQASPATFSAAMTLLRGLATRPGAVDEAAMPITPDVRVVQKQGRWQVELTRHATPRLDINHTFARMIGSMGAEANSLRGQLTEARWLIKSLHQRQETILKVAQAVLARQFKVLNHGLEACRPLALKEIADVVGVHESTVCRAVNGKYVALPGQTLELRAFFSQPAGEDSVAGVAARALVKRLIAGEAAERPLDDAALTDALAQRGIRLARRTVAKYREALGYPAARDRAHPIAA